MDALEVIDLSDNILIGEFPDFLANFPKLKVLNLANNFLNGTVPTSLRDKSEANELELTLTGKNMTLCFSDENTCRTIGLTPTSNKTPNLGIRIAIRIGIGLGILIGLFVICLVIVLIIGQCQKRKAVAASGSTGEISGLAMPVNAETQQQMHPTVQSIRVGA
ncbi:LRR receptor-like serine/threonine-protein kinase IOS1 [Papaver somniferum]|nr:LRR receptor-like serine/threonine-protein kinase IOS1 [Papaver somniferum]